MYDTFSKMRSQRAEPLSSPQVSPSSPRKIQSDILTNPGRLYELFCKSLESMWILWELMVIGEPILVVGDTPKGASDAVFALIELIKPIPFGGDFRPYFT